MPTQKRRVVYLADEDWDQIKAEASRTGETISAYIRAACAVRWMVDRKEIVEATSDRTMREFRPAPKPGHK